MPPLLIICLYLVSIIALRVSHRQSWGESVYGATFSMGVVYIIVTLAELIAGG